MYNVSQHKFKLTCQEDCKGQCANSRSNSFNPFESVAIKGKFHEF